MLFVSIFVLLWAWDITTIFVYIILALVFISSILFLPTTQTFISFVFQKNEENQLNLFNKGLYDFLNEEFLLCGKEVNQGYYS